MAKDVKLVFDVTAGNLKDALGQATAIAAGFLGVPIEDVDTGRFKLKATPGQIYRSGSGGPAQILGWRVHVRYRQ